MTPGKTNRLLSFMNHELLRGSALRAKVMRGGVWLGGGNVAEQATRFARNMILTRLLAPSAFGAMAIVMSSSAIVGALTEVGVRQAVIQNPRGGEKEYLDAGWWLGLGRALFTYFIIFAMAPWVAHFYGIADLSSLLRVTLLGTLFDGAMSPRSALAQRELKFGRWMIISNGGAICGVILTVVLSFVIRDVWALAIGFGSENAFRCLLSFILYPGLPSLKWARWAVRELYGFSKQAFGLSFLNLIFSRTDIFVLGKLYSATDLGLYSMGVALIVTPSIFLTNMLAQTLFPAFTHVQNDKERINRILIEVILVGGFARNSGCGRHLPLRALPAIGCLWGAICRRRGAAGSRLCRRFLEYSQRRDYMCLYCSRPPGSASPRRRRFGRGHDHCHLSGLQIIRNGRRADSGAFGDYCQLPSSGDSHARTYGAGYSSLRKNHRAGDADIRRGSCCRLQLPILWLSRQASSEYDFRGRGVHSHLCTSAYCIHEK